MIRLVFYLFGFFFLTTGLAYTILFLNLLTMGYSFDLFVQSVLFAYPGFCIVLGFVMIFLTIFYRKRRSLN